MNRLPLPPLNIQIPPSLPSWILFLRRVGLLSVFIHTPAIALSKISLSSMKPKPREHIHGCFVIEAILFKQYINYGNKENNKTVKSLLLTWVVNQNAAILASPDLVPSDLRIAARPGEGGHNGKVSSCFNTTLPDHPNIRTLLRWILLMLLVIICHVTQTLFELQSTCDCRYHCLQAHRGHCHRSKLQPVKMAMKIYWL